MCPTALGPALPTPAKHDAPAAQPPNQHISIAAASGAADLTAACRGAGGVAARGVAAVRGLSASSLRIKRQREVLPLLAIFDGAVAEWQRRQAAALPQHSGLGDVHDARLLCGGLRVRSQRALHCTTIVLLGC